MILTKEQCTELLEVSKPLIKWLNETCHPHCTALVNGSKVELVEGIACQRLRSCDCEACRSLFGSEGRVHTSDCAVHNAPAMKKGNCDCEPVAVDCDKGFLYRDHCGSLADSMETEQRFGSFDELEKHVHGLEGMCGDEKITTEPCGFDKRNGWDTHIVLVNGNAVGFTNGQPLREME